MMDNPLTVAPELNSTWIGRAQGIYAMSSQQSELSLLTTLTFAYNCSVVRRNPNMNEVLETPVVGRKGISGWLVDLVVDNLRKSRSMEKNKLKDDDVKSFMRRNYTVQVSEDGLGQSESSGDRMRQYSSKSSIKNSIDDELPELVVFLQETNYEFVKDICIDKAVTSREKYYKENCDVENGYVPSMLEYNVAKSDSESTEKSEDLESSVSSTESTEIVEKDLINRVSEKQKVHSVAIDEIPSDVSNKKSVPKLNFDRKVTSKRTAASTNSIAISLTKILDENKHKGKGVAESQIEHGSIFCNSSLSPSTIRGGCSSGRAGCRQCCDRGSTSTAKNYAPENQTGLYRSHFGFVYQRDDSSSAVDPAFNTLRRPSLSSFSSSGSLRSNSSTNSSHSFAFPILQTEWNGSPERMAKADPAQRRRQKLWRLCFSCFNF